jgi:hypothetical protein
MLVSIAGLLETSTSAVSILVWYFKMLLCFDIYCSLLKIIEWKMVEL